MLKENELDLVAIINTIWSEKSFIIKVTGCFLLLGIFVAFTSKVEYEANCKLLPESQDAKTASLGGLGGLAGLAGFDLSGFGGSDVLSPDLYPELVYSVPFLDSLINTPIYFEGLDTSITSIYFFKEVDRPSLIELFGEYTLGLPGKLRKGLSDKNNHPISDYGLIRFSKEDWDIIEEYEDRLTVNVDSETGIINLSVEMPDPVAAAMLTKLLVEELTSVVVNYKLEKSRINLSFIQERFDEAKKDYETKQMQLAQFADRNRNISNSLVQIEYERIQNELNVAFEVYKGLATQLEQTKINIEEKTPVFTVLEPVRIPEEKSRPKRVLVLMSFLFLGFISSVIYILIKQKINV